MPNVVKGSKQKKMVVVPHRPLRHFIFTLCLLIGVGISAVGGFAYGYYSGRLQQDTVQTDRSGLQQEISHLELENDTLRGQLAILNRSSQMDQRANTEVQGTISALRLQLAELEQENTHYRQVVSEQTEDTGLTLGQFDLSATAQPRQFRYKLVLRQQDADGDTYLHGHANVNLVGRLGDEQLELPLRDLSADVEQLDIRLRFRYFQNIEGELALPEGFDPIRVQITAVATEPVAKSIEQDFDWLVEGE